MQATRRQLLSFGFLTAVVVASNRFLPKSSISVSSNGDISVETAMEWARNITSARSQIHPQYVVGLTSQSDVNNWIREIVPYFEYEQIDKEGEVGQIGSLNYPEVSFVDYQDGRQHNHLLGQAFVFKDRITLSGRFTNPMSPWFGREDSIITLIHELAHKQGIYFSTRLDAEASAQLVSLEIAAAMINRGNKLVIASLLEDFKYMTVATVRYLLEQEERTDGWLPFRNEIYPTALEQAVLDKSDRYWQNDLEALSRIYYSYNYVPINELYKALNSNQRIEGVTLPINWTFTSAQPYDYLYNNTPEATPIPPHEPLIVDDLAYFFDHMSEMVGDLHS